MPAPLGSAACTPQARAHLSVIELKTAFPWSETEPLLPLSVIFFKKHLFPLVVGGGRARAAVLFLIALLTE